MCEMISGILRRNIADGASGGATLMSYHPESFMQKSSPNRKSPTLRSGHSKTSRTAKATKPARRSTRKTTGSSPKLASSPSAASTVSAFAKTSKQAKLLELLMRPAGASIAALAEASCWQPHSVRGFLAGVVRKKLGLALVSAVEADQRIYRVLAAKQA